MILQLAWCLNCGSRWRGTGPRAGCWWIVGLHGLDFLILKLWIGLSSYGGNSSWDMDLIYVHDQWLVDQWRVGMCLRS